MPKIKELIQPPPEPEGNGEQQIAALRDYLVKITQELYYLLTHLEADNINDSTFQRISEMIPKPYVGQPLMDGTASSGGSGNWSRGDHRHPADTSKADVTALEEEAALLAAHVGDHTNPHEVTAAQVGLGNVANERQYSADNPPPTPSAADVGAIPATEKGSAGGVAELDSSGHVPSSQLPSYVDDVLEYPTLADFPVTGESGKIYVAQDTNKTYRWSGSAYREISESLALGETSSTAYRGDRGKAAYDHSQVTSGNPHNVSASDVGLGNVANERQYSANNPPPLPTPADIGAATAQDLSDHVGDTNNPHGVTAAQVGARPDTWMPTAADVGARADTWMPTAADVGARPDTWTPSAADVGARPDTWVPDAEDVLYDNTGSGLTANDVQAAIDELAQGGGGGGPSPSDANPLRDGTAAPGTAATYSRSDHVHPTDTSRAPSAAVAESLFQTATDIHGDTTVTLTKSFSDYAYLAVLVTPDSANTTLTRTMLMIPVNMLNLMPNVPVVLVDSNAQVTWGYMTIGLVSTTITNQLRFRRTSFSSLYLQRINGIR